MINDIVCVAIDDEPMALSVISGFCERKGNCRIFRTGDLVTQTRMTLKSLIDILPAEGFVRIHRSFVVAADKVSSFNRKEVYLSCGKVLPVGRQYAENIEI